MNNPSLVVLAAGMGSRYGGLKQMDTFGPNGETIIDYSVYDAIRAGFGKIYFVIRRSLEQDFTEAVVSKIGRHIPVELIYQELDQVPGSFTVPTTRKKPWGTGHAVWSAGKQVKEPFAVINADDFYGFSAFEQVASFLKTTGTGLTTPAWCLAGYVLASTLSENGSVSRGLCMVDDQNNLLSVKELKEIRKNGDQIIAQLPDQEVLPLTGKETVSMNFWGFTPAIFPILDTYFQDFLKEQGQSEKGEFYLSEAVNQMLTEKRAQVTVLTSTDQWMGVTYPEDKITVTQQLTQLISDGLYPEVLWPASNIY